MPKVTYTARRITANHYEVTYREERWFRRARVEICEVERLNFEWYYIANGQPDPRQPVGRYSDVYNAIVYAQIAEDAVRVRAEQDALPRPWRCVESIPTARVVKK